jgi:hypothetical protein
VTNDDIAGSQVIAGETASRFSVAVTFNAAGAEKMRRTTARHVGDLLAMLIDGPTHAHRRYGPGGNGCNVRSSGNLRWVRRRPSVRSDVENLPWMRCAAAKGFPLAPPNPDEFEVARGSLSRAAWISGSAPRPFWPLC